MTIILSSWVTRLAFSSFSLTMTMTCQRRASGYFCFQHTIPLQCKQYIFLGVLHYPRASGGLLAAEFLVGYPNSGRLRGLQSGLQEDSCLQVQKWMPFFREPRKLFKSTCEKGAGPQLACGGVIRSRSASSSQLQRQASQLARSLGWRQGIRLA